MSKKAFFVTGTDTDVGKTIASSWLMLHMNGVYWKPVQSGIAEDVGDTQTIKSITGFKNDRFIKPIYELQEPLSPHEAAKRENVNIDMNNFSLPNTSNALIVEGAGGLMVPLNKDYLMVDLMKQLDIPIVLTCRSGLGTINHTLLSIELIKNRGLELVGIIINGKKSPHNREALEEYGKVPVIAEIDYLDNVSKEKLLAIKAEIEL